MPEPLTGELANLMTLLDDPTNIIIAHLAQNPIPATVDTVLLTDFTECNFPGYAPQRISNTIPFESSNELYGEAISQPLLFTATGITAMQMITAVYVTVAVGSGPAKLAMVDLFAVPVVIHQEGQSFAYELHFESVNDDEM